MLVLSCVTVDLLTVLLYSLRYVKWRIKLVCVLYTTARSVSA